MAFPFRVVVALATVTVVATPAQGQTTWYVDDTNYPGPGSGTQADPFCKIQDGIDATLDGDEVVVGPGTYNETINLNGKAITVRSSDGPAVTTIDGTGLNDSVVKCVSGEGPQTILQGLTITGGTGTLVAHLGRFIGGGMYSHGSSPTLTNCIFNDNMADIGGGMYIDNLGSPTLTNCTLSDNTADIGGGMYISFASATLVNCDFNANAAGYGGGIEICFEGTATLTNCRFAGNSAAYGGAISYFPDGDVILTLTNCLFTGNSAAFDGGGIYDIGAGGEVAVTLTNCTLSRNTAGGTGGGISIYVRQPTLSNCILWGNMDTGGMDESAQLSISFGSFVVDYSCIQGLNSLAGTGNIGDDPLFIDADGPDGIAGTPDDNLRLTAGSPCIDAGDNTAVPSDSADLDGDGDTTERTPLDLAGNPRFLDHLDTVDTGVDDLPTYPDVVDMGAYEAQELLEPPALAPPPHDILKNRYITIDPRGAGRVNVGKNMDIRLTLSSTQMNGVTAIGSEWWANSPDARCIALVGPSRPPTPRNWDACPTLHLTGCPIIPTSTYAIATIAGEDVSIDLLASTQAKPGAKWYGDCVGFFNGTKWTAPNGETSIDDAVAAIKTFQNPDRLPGCPTPPCNAAHTSVMDMTPNLIPGPQINKIVSIDDVFAIIQGFQGGEYPGGEIELCLDP